MQGIKSTFLALAFCAICTPQLNAQTAPWFFGVGTGIARLNSEGDQGVHTNAFGPVQVEFDLAPEDFDDLMQTGFGLGGYATNGAWMLQASLGVLKLGDDPSATLPGGLQVDSDLFFDIFSAEFTVGYTAYRSPGNGFALRPHLGTRFISHELGADLTITSGGVSTDISRKIEESWVDVLVGTTIDIKLSEKWGWSTVVDAGFGGSEGTYRASTALPWRFARHWSLSPNFSFMAIEYENGTRGDSDWYLYDSNEFSWGLAVMVHF